jgi:hypothetical protein
MQYLIFIRQTGIFDFLLINFLSFENYSQSKEKIMIIFISFIIIYLQKYDILIKFEKKICKSYLFFIIYQIINIYFPETLFQIKNILIYFLSYIVLDSELKK